MSIKKHVKSLIRIVLVLSLCISAMAVPGFAGVSYDYPESESGIYVRVNGMLIEFPDEQPYIDENNRTMMPIRFVIEALGAEAEWLGETRTAKITKGDTVVSIPIGSNIITVVEGGKERTVTMDTKSVLNNGRTFIPIRFIAEALGAYVDWASAYSTACFYDDVLTAEQIAKLQAYDYTLPLLYETYEDYLAKRGEERAALMYGTDRHTFHIFANAREHLYHTAQGGGLTKFPTIEETINVHNDIERCGYFQLLVEETIAQMSYNSSRLSVEFMADTSCIYQADNKDNLGCVVRGICAITLLTDFQKCTGDEQALMYKLGIRETYPNQTVYIDMDVHMDTAIGKSINLIVPLSETYFTL